MKRRLRLICSVLFLGAAMAVICFLQLFTHVDSVMEYIDWETSVQIAADGTEQPFSADSYSNLPEHSGTYRFIGRLPEGLPAGTLLFETSGLELTLSLNGTEIWQSKAENAEGSGYALSQAQIPLAAGSSGELAATCTILEGSISLFPPLVRFVPENLAVIETTAYTNREALPAGAAALALILIFGVFLLGILLGKPDWSLIPLIAAAAGLASFRLIQSQGYYFLPEGVYQLLGRPATGLCIILALVLYLILNRRRRFWRYLGLAAAWSAAAFLICFLVSFASGGSFAHIASSLLSSLAQTGQYDGVVYWITLWLTLVCALISAHAVIQAFTDQQIQTQGLLLKARKIEENYQALENWTEEASARQHEINHQLTALECLYQKGAYEKMGDILSQLLADQGSRSFVTFTENRTVNTILQDAAGRAKRGDIRFYALASLPEELNIPENDLCSLLMNMLDNALEAAEKVMPPQNRYISIRIRVAELYLAVSCENSFSGEILRGKDGELLTTKENPAVHGFGCRQMKKIAEKYQSIVRFETEDDHIFIAQTALRIPDKA